MFVMQGEVGMASVVSDEIAKIAKVLFGTYWAAMFQVIGVEVASSAFAIFCVAIGVFMDMETMFSGG